MDVLRSVPLGADGLARGGFNTEPNEFEIEIEFCTRSTFHTQHQPQKYADYFNQARAALFEKYPATRIIGNPEDQDAPKGMGRRAWKVEDHLGPLEDVSRPRLGAFEVTMRSRASGEARRIFSKLESGRWPNAKALVRRVEQLLDGEEPLPPLPPVKLRPISSSKLPLPGIDALKVRRHLPVHEPRCERSWKGPSASGNSTSATRGQRLRHLRELGVRLHNKHVEPPESPRQTGTPRSERNNSTRPSPRKPSQQRAASEGPAAPPLVPVPPAGPRPGAGKRPSSRNRQLAGAAPAQEKPPQAEPPTVAAAEEKGDYPEFEEDDEPAPVAVVAPGASTAEAAAEVVAPGASTAEPAAVAEVTQASQDVSLPPAGDQSGVVPDAAAAGPAGQGTPRTVRASTYSAAAQGDELEFEEDDVPALAPAQAPYGEDEFEESFGPTGAQPSSGATAVQPQAPQAEPPKANDAEDFEDFEESPPQTAPADAQRGAGACADFEDFEESPPQTAPAVATEVSTKDFDDFEESHEAEVSSKPEPAVQTPAVETHLDQAVVAGAEAAATPAEVAMTPSNAASAKEVEAAPASAEISAQAVATPAAASSAEVASADEKPAQQLLGDAETAATQEAMPPAETVPAETAKQDEVKDDELESAATKIQAVHRGKALRKQNEKEKEKKIEAKLKEEKELEGAATKIQAAHRGNATRKQKLKRREEDAKAKEDTEMQAAATKIQAVHRGKAARRNAPQSSLAVPAAPQAPDALVHEQEMERAAVRIQAVQRGKAARRKAPQTSLAVPGQAPKAPEALAEEQEMERAAVRIQAMHRGNAARGKKQKVANHTLVVIDDDRALGAAATKIQAIHRGNASRKQIIVQPPPSSNSNTLAVDENKAATRIQAMQRGKTARRQMLQVPAERAPASAAEGGLAVVAVSTATSIDTAVSSEKPQAANADQSAPEPQEDDYEDDGFDDDMDGTAGPNADNSVAEDAGVAQAKEEEYDDDEDAYDDPDGFDDDDLDGTAGPNADASAAESVGVVGGKEAYDEDEYDDDASGFEDEAAQGSEAEYSDDFTRGAGDHSQTEAGAVRASDAADGDYDDDFNSSHGGQSANSETAAAAAGGAGRYSDGSVDHQRSVDMSADEVEGDEAYSDGEFEDGQDASVSQARQDAYEDDYDDDDAASEDEEVARSNNQRGAQGGRTSDSDSDSFVN